MDQIPLEGGRRGLLEDEEAAQRWHALRSFGAVPLACDAVPLHRLGRLPASRTLVAAYLPHERVEVGTLLALLVLRDALGARFDRLVVLAWRFTPSIHEDLLGLNVSGLFLIRAVGPPVPRAVASAPLRFEPLRRLQLGPVLRCCTKAGAREQLSLTLGGYRAPPGMGERDLSTSTGLALLRWWAIDPAYDGMRWRPAWESPAIGPAAALPLSLQLDLPPCPGPRTLCVRACDRDGMEAQLLASAHRQG